MDVTASAKLIQRESDNIGDTSDTMAASKALRQNEQLWQFALEGNGDGVWDWNLTENQVIYSKRCWEFLGFAEPIEAESAFELTSRIHPDDLAMVSASMIRLLKTDDSNTAHECRLLRKDGSIVWILTRGRVISRDANGRALRAVGTHTDISATKDVEAELLETQGKLQSILSSAPDAIYGLDNRGIISFVNPAGEKLLGHKANDIVGTSLYQLVLPDSRLLASPGGATENGWFHRFGCKSEHHIEETFLKSDGSEIGAEYMSMPMLRGDELVGSVVTVRDVSAKRALQDQVRLAALVYQHSSESMMVTDSEMHIIATNPAFRTMTNIDENVALGRLPSTIGDDFLPADLLSTVTLSLQEQKFWQGEIKHTENDGDQRVQWMTVNEILSESGSVNYYVWLFLDITEKKKSESLIWRQVNFDSLTGLANRKMFSEILEKEIEKSCKTNRPFALLFIDLDHFKDVNDTLGHHIGDKLLVEAARRICGCVRSSDIVARFGGDEFTVILPDLADADRIEQIVDGINCSLSQPFQVAKEKLFITASIGITLYPNDADRKEDLFKFADQAMYLAKAEGRNCFRFFTKHLQDNAEQQRLLTTELRRAADGQQFQLVYQPIINLATGALHKAEALIRWNHPVRGVIGPADFIPLAEESRLIVDIGNWVFREAVDQVTQWRKSIHPDFQISVNKSPVQFHDVNSQRNFNWFQYLRSKNLPGDAVSVEITEGILLDKPRIVAGKLLAFRDAGMQVSLDDFGTGYSSLAYLKKFDIDYIKIDRAFVHSIESGGDDMVLCEAMIVMAHKLGIKVIAEGVETEQQSRLLAAAGCDFGQGYYYSRPVSAENFEAFCHGRKHYPPRLVALPEPSQSGVAGRLG